MIFSVTGCRESLVLTQIIHDQQAQEKDTKSDTKVAKNDKESNIQDDQLNKQKDTDTKRKTDDKQEKSVKGKGNNGTANDTTHNSNANNSKNNDSDGKKSDNTGTDDGKKQDDSTAGESDDPNARQVYDSNGNVVDLPKNVNSVAAAGNVGIIAQMLGGKGILTGTSANVKEGMASTVFSDEGIGKAVTYWTGKGDSPMSSSSFNTLVKADPDVCLCESGSNSFSSGQIATLKKKKIAYLTVPRLNTYSNIKSCVEAIGEAIGNRTSKGGQNASSLATKYVKYADGLIDDVEGQTGYYSWNNKDYNRDAIANGEKAKKNTAKNGKYALYVSDWSSGTFTMSLKGSQIWSETGIAVAPHGYSDSPLSYFMSSAGVCNNGARFSRNTSSEYAVTPFNINNVKASISGGYSLYPDTNESFARAYNGSSVDYGLGETKNSTKKFSAVIVANNSIKSAFEQSEDSGMWKNNGKVTVNGTTDYGFNAGGNLITSYVRGSYNVYVNPSGVSEWSEGSAESVLETIWTAWKFQGFSESDVKTNIKEFYSTFYRYDLSDNQVNSILAGK